LKFLSPTRQEVSLADAAVMTWGGLRGAVGLALAVQVRVHRAEDDNGNYHISKKDAQRILFYVAGVAFLTLLLNATTCPLLVKKLGIAATPSAKKDLQNMLLQQMIKSSNLESQSSEVAFCLRHVLNEVKDHIQSQDSTTGSNDLMTMMGAWSGQQKLNSRIQNMLRGSRSSSEKEIEAHSSKLIRELEEVRYAYSKLSKEDLSLLGTLPDMFLCLKEPQLIELVSQTPIDWLRAEAVKSAMLNLVHAQYWHLLETRDLSPGSFEARVLIASISLARSQFNGELTDFHYILPHILYSEDEVVDTEIAFPVNLASFSKTLAAERSSMPTRLSTSRVSLSSSKTKNLSERTSTPVSRFSGGSVMLEHSILEDFGFERTKSFIESASFSVIMALMIVLNGVYILVEEEVRNSSNDTDKSWFVIEVVFCVIFTIESMLKLCDQGWAYFQDGWNNFDLALVLLGIFGLVVNMMASEMGDSNVSNEARIVRVAKVFRLFRLLRLFRLIRFIAVLKAKLAKEEYSPEVAEHMVKMAILTCFIRAHLLAQKEFFDFFCDWDNDVRSVEVARCMLQSQAFVYMALCLATKEVQVIDKGLLEKVNSIKQSKEITENLEHFVLAAYEHGVLAGREAEAVLTPLHLHIKECMRQIGRAENGRGVSESPSKESGDAIATVATSLRAAETTLNSVGEEGHQNDLPRDFESEENQSAPQDSEASDADFQVAWVLHIDLLN
jgi:hypothetical protein